MDSLKDITPEDLFPGVAYSITEDDGDEDMPYTRPVRPRPKESNGEVAVDKAAGMVLSKTGPHAAAPGPISPGPTARVVLQEKYWCYRTELCSR